MNKRTATNRTVPVPPLIGKLPPPCRRDLDTLCHFVQEQIAHEVPGDAVPPDQFRNVLLTGATGFVGRFFLRELLRQNDNLTVQCLVRAENTEQGFERIRQAMEIAEIWEDGFAQRLSVLVGDLTQERLGLSSGAFDDLCQELDAVYHVAADVGLVRSYDDIREINSLALRSILVLCSRTRFKHLFYASTMAVFPQYMCDFANEYRRSYIDDQMQPDLDKMKKVFPLSVMGYSWSKLVGERAVLSAKEAGVPVAIFRLPQMGLSSTGYAQPNNFPSRVFAAAAQHEQVPTGFSIQRNPEPVDTVCRICAAISTNPARRFTIYHCCDPNPHYDDLEIADFGFFWREVSYHSFRRSCQAAGQQSPLHGQWVLIDQFARYWFVENEPHRTQPVSDRAIREDCPLPIQWPALLIKHARSYEWIRRHREEWPYPIPQGSLDFDGLIALAERYAERLEVPFATTYPDWMQAGLKRLVESLNSAEAGLKTSRIGHVSYGLARSLRNNAALARERQQHPEIEVEKIEKPVFIVGINRTGTTLLHRLLARDPKFCALRRYESTEPVMKSGEYAVAGTTDDPRRSYAEELIKATQFVETLSGIHRIDLDEPEEDFWFLWLAFATWVFAVAHYIPEYGRWLAATGSHNAYAHHRRIMQHLTWQRRQRKTPSGRSWLLKMPFHLMELEALLAAYPDAVFIQTHRDPVQFMGSWNSVVERVRSFTIEPWPRQESGAEQLVLMSRMLNGAMKFRDSHPELDRRWVDVRYVDLIDDPMRVVRDIYSRLDWPLEAVAVDAMEDWLVRQAEQRQQEPHHEYRLEDFGLSAETIDDAFASYRAFVAARNIM